MKKIIRLTESDLHQIVKESVNRILDESFKSSVISGIRHPFNKEKRSRLKAVLDTEPNTNDNGRARRRYGYLTDPSAKAYMDKKGYDDKTGNYHPYIE